MKLTKTKQIKALLNENGALTPKEVAKHVDCDLSLVYMVMRAMAKRKTRKTTVTPSVSLVEASKTIIDLTKRLNNISVAFHNDMDKVSVMWFDESYYVDVKELPKFIESMEFIKSKEYNYGGSCHDNS